MTTHTPALSASAAGAPLLPVTIARRALRDDDVLIDIAYAGICHSDIHQVRGEWGRGNFPMVPGHEIAGTVAAVGSAVTRHRVGDRVGVGCMVDSCGVCAACKDGHEHFCEQRTVFTYNDVNYDDEPAFGGYSQQIVVSERFVVRIPAAIGLDVAAPLLCAGVTTYSPLKRWGAGPGKKVAVVGMGGLGHVAVKIAAAMGAEVTVLSQTLGKRDDGLAFGASDYRATRTGTALRDLRGTFDIMINTVSADIDLDAHLRTLRTFGVMVNVGLPPKPQALRIGSLTNGDKVLTGSNIGGIPITQEMLDFCGSHGIGATVEVIGGDDVNDAYDKVVSSAVRYRYVIDTATLAS